jgi:hypothetical protein
MGHGTGCLCGICVTFGPKPLSYLLHPMKASFCLFVALCLTVSAGAQAPAGQYAPEQLDQLLGPIALYPDPLIALILPASTAPSDISAAAQYLASGGDPSATDSQSWDPSVKGLAHYPDVLKWMNDNLSWTQTLGAAFSMQPADVMKSIQQLRAEAKAAGTLVDTPQQQVDIEDDDIRIIPTQANMIYVPEYDPNDVYDVPEGYSGPFVTFGAGYAVGPWLGFELDWDDFGVWAGPWHPGWDYRRDWRDPHFSGSRWHPNPARGRELVRNFYRPGASMPGARPIAGARAAARGPAPSTRGTAPVARPAPDYRGYGQVAPRPSTPAPSGALFGGYNRGTQVRDYSTRGSTSRQAPVRSAPSGRSSQGRSSSPHSGDKDRPH